MSARTAPIPPYHTRADPSLTQILDPQVLADPYPLYRRLREQDPVHWDPLLHAWIVTRYEDVLTVLHGLSAQRTPTPEYLGSIGLSSLSPIASVMVKQMLFLDPPAHTRIRSLAASAFTPRCVSSLRDRIREVVTRLLDEAAPIGRMDVVADFAEPLPNIITAEMLGVPIEDAPELKRWSRDFAEMLGNFQHNPERAPVIAASLEQMIAYFREAIRETRLHPRPGLIHSFLTSECDGQRFTDDEVIANTILTMVGGQETTTSLIANAVLTLLRHPAELQRLRGDLSLLPSAVEEVLRYEPPSQQTARVATANTTIGGKSIERRQAVIAVIAAANRDPERFVQPDTFDISRSDNRHLSFGWAAHFCFGAVLARAEAQIALEEMLRRFPVWSLCARTVSWRSNLGLRGLLALPISFS